MVILQVTYRGLKDSIIRAFYFLLSTFYFVAQAKVEADRTSQPLHPTLPRTDIPSPPTLLMISAPPPPQHFRDLARGRRRARLSIR